MSFSKAKRFVYKSPDVDCSPADYLFSLGLEKGCSMLKSSRFRKTKNDKENSLVCSRTSHSCCSRQNNEESKRCTKQSNNVDDDRNIEFNRNSALRKSIKVQRKNDKTKTTTTTNNQCNTNQQCQNSRHGNMSLYEIEEFIDDDYGSMTSSEEMYDLQNIEDHEFNEIYNAIKKIQLKRRSLPANKRTSNFEDTVLKKLDNIDRNVKTIKEDVTCLPPKTSLKQLHYHQTPNIKNSGVNQHCQFHHLKPNQELIKNIIMKTIQKLVKNFQCRTKSVKQISQEHVLNMIAEIYAINKKSNTHIKELCNLTAEELVHNINNVFQISACEYCAPGNETDDMWEEVKECFTDNILHNWNSSSLENLISGYLEQTQEVDQELEDISDITLKCMDTQQMLDVQGALLDKMKNEIENLKSNLL